MFKNILEITLSMSLVITVILLLTPIFNKIYSAKWRCIIWLIIAVRLVIPFNISLPEAPMKITHIERTLVIKQVKTDNFPNVTIDNTISKETTDTPMYSDESYTQISLSQLAQIIWISGMTIFFLYHITNYLIFRNIIKKYSDNIHSNIFEKVLLDMNIKIKPKLFLCKRIVSPMMIGFIKPTILLPNVDYSDKELEVILKHELTHYKNLHLWYKLLLLVANSIHWFNPLVYFMSKQANRDLEYCCDDIVIKDSDLEFRKNYSNIILKSIKKGG